MNKEDQQPTETAKTSEKDTRADNLKHTRMGATTCVARHAFRTPMLSRFLAGTLQPARCVK